MQFKINKGTITAKKQDKIHIITGPLAGGKSTFKHKLEKKLGMELVEELPYGVDIETSDGWQDILDYAADNNTIVVETHFRYAGTDPGDRNAINKLKKIAKPPKNVFIHFIKTTPKKLIARQNARNYGSDMNTVKEDLLWYDKIYDQIPSNQKEIVNT